MRSKHFIVLYNVCVLCEFIIMWCVSSCLHDRCRLISARPSVECFGQPRLRLTTTHFLYLDHKLLLCTTTHQALETLCNAQRDSSQTQTTIYDSVTELLLVCYWNVS